MLWRHKSKFFIHSPIWRRHRIAHWMEMDGKCFHAFSFHSVSIVSSKRVEHSSIYFHFLSILLVLLIPAVYRLFTYLLYKEVLLFCYVQLYRILVVLRLSGLEFFLKMLKKMILGIYLLLPAFHCLSCLRSCCWLVMYECNRF